MEATVSYVSMLQKYINSNQKILKKDYTRYLGNISKEFTINNMKKTRVKGSVNFCCC